jgi:uncharacterized protein (DUF302 family)
MEHKIEVRHIIIEIKSSFEQFTQKFEGSLGRFEPSLVKDVATNPSAAEKLLRAAEGAEGLMIFAIRDHGALLNIMEAPRQAKQYDVGNPLIAATMTRHDIRAGLYAPLRIYVYEGADHTTRVEYDQPSSLFGQFENPVVAGVGKSLDAKLANAIRKADSGAEKAHAD